MPKMMLIGSWELSDRRTIRARFVRSHLVITAEGDLPNPGYAVAVDAAPTSGLEPLFAVLRQSGPGDWTSVQVPFVHNEVFPVQARPDRILVQHASGQDEVEVIDADEELAAFVSSLPGEDDLSRSVEATGYARSLSFDDAFADAITRLGPTEEDQAGRIRRVTVVDSGALFGGGFAHFFVKVRREND